MRRLIFQTTLTASVEAGQTIRVFDDGSSEGLPEGTIVLNYFLPLMHELQGQLIRERTDHVNAESTGGPAFPTMEVRTTDTQDLVANASQGMTLRDYFAAKAMQGELSAQSEESGFYDSFEMLAKKSYELADAMLKARK